MSREIKFRVWNKNTNKYEYTESDYYFVIDQRIKAYEYEQYTGLKDKNGKEICEGDIVKDYSGRIGEVYFDEGRLAYLFSDPHSWDQWWVRSEFGEYEVIGNIHENGDLLGGGE